jgi:hypothetical protein
VGDWAAYQIKKNLAGHTHQRDVALMRGGEPTLSTHLGSRWLRRCDYAHEALGVMAALKGKTSCLSSRKS